MSLWRDDVNRSLLKRAFHLLQKSYPKLRWIWVVGDSSDATHEMLETVAEAVYPDRRVDVSVCDTSIVGDAPAVRRIRLGVTANAWFDKLEPEDHYLLVHESDLLSPVDVVERLLDHVHSGRCPIAGWPVLPIPNGGALFYDIWAYRKDGQMFSNVPPYHACYNAEEPFEVDSVGSCWMFEAEDARQGARFGDQAVLSMCRTLRAKGRRFWVDPKLTIVQPSELWVPYSAVD